MTDEELAEWADEPATETVKIGKKNVLIRAVTDPTKMAELIQVAKGRAALQIEIDGKKVRPKEGEAMLYTWLEAGAIDPPLTYLQILKISKRTAFDCVNAGERVMILSGATDTAVDEAKNASGEEATEAPSGPKISGPTVGSVASSLPA